VRDFCFQTEPDLPERGLKQKDLRPAEGDTRDSHLSCTLKRIMNEVNNPLFDPPPNPPRGA